MSGEPAANDSSSAAGSSSRVELSIIVPCHNEAENVIELAERMRATLEPHGLAFELVLVNDASTDHTGALIDDLSRRYDFVCPVHHPTNRGMTAGWASGLAASTGRYVVIMDGDLQNLPEDVYRLYRELKYSNADIVQGYRSHIGRARDFRYSMSRVLHYMLRALFGTRLSDIKCGFLICEREVFAHILRRRFSYYYFQTFIVVSAHHKGYRIEEIETLFEERMLGESFISSFPFKMILKNLVDLAKGFVEFRLLSTHTDILSDFLGKHPPARKLEPPSFWRRLRLQVFAFLMPLHHWKLSSAALRYYHQLGRLQWLPPEQVRDLQEARLRALVKHAHRHVPFYRERLDQLGIQPDEIQTIADLERLPLLSKDDIRRNLHFDLLSDKHDKRSMLPVTTCGSHGEPLTLYTDRMHLDMRWATTLRSREWTGYRFGDSQVRLWVGGVATARLQAVRAWIDAVGSGWTGVPGVGTGAQSVQNAVRVLRNRKPALLESTSELLFLVASIAADSSQAGSFCRAALSSGATLSTEDRERIETSLHTEIFEQYSSRELGVIAQECNQHRGLHIHAESYIVEIVKDGRTAKPGETGDVVVTDLTNLSVPLIRYAIGDRATAAAAPCPCGRGLPLLGTVETRPPALVSGKIHQWVPGAFFAEILKDYGHIVRRFQVVQERGGPIALKLVKAPRFSEASLRKLLDRIHDYLGTAIEIDVRLVDHIEPGVCHTISPWPPEATGG